MESPESWFHRRATSYVEAQILFHLNQAGVFRLLSETGEQTAPAIAGALRLDASATDALLDYVFEVDELLERDQAHRYSLSEFGRRVLERFSTTTTAGAAAVNMFDVRVGAYGPVWQNLGAMLTQSGRYGHDFHREGRYAEDGVFKLAMRFWNSLIEHVEAPGVESLVEVGLTTGLIERLGERYPDHALYGLDRSQEAIDRSAARAATRAVTNVCWIQGDYFDPQSWCAAIDASRKGVLYSLHFHELMACGEERFVAVLRRLKEALPQWTVVAFEQPRLPHGDRATTPETLWLYAQSNILIHHLIGNGRILSRDAWIALGHEAGCRAVTDRECNYLGYRAFAFQL